MPDIRKILYGECLITCDDRDAIRLMNICSHKKIKTWVDPNKEKTGFVIYTDDRKIVEETAADCMIEIEISESNGIFTRIKNNKKRFSVIIGFILFAVLIYWESLYIWHIDIEGCGQYTDDEVLRLIELEYPCYGVKKENIDINELKKIITDNLREVCWVSCNIKGTKLTISLKESVDVFEGTDMDTPCNIVASMDCTIYSIVTSSGTPVAIAGDEVKKGDILISGSVNICNDNSEVVDTRHVAANGDVFGISKIRYKEEIKYDYYKKEIKGKNINKITIRIGKYCVTPYKTAAEYNDSDQESDEYVVRIGDFYMPISFTMDRNILYDVRGERYTEDQAASLAEQHLMTYIGKLQEKGVQIVRKNVIITKGKDGIIAEGDITIKLSVGVPDVIKP